MQPIKKKISVPRESLDAMLFKMWSSSTNESYRGKIWKMAGAIGRLGTEKIKTKSGTEIDIYRLPDTWFNWIKEQYELPI